MIVYNSRNVEKGDTFICLPGGEKYVNEAKSKGAKEVLYLNRWEMGDLADKYFKSPSTKLRVIGVTGTNGKTTTTHLVAHVLRKLGYTTGLMGTLSGKLTTPESIDIQKSMAELVDKGGTHFVMEVSSHAIHQGRISGIKFFIKLLTNITQDHLDYHKNLEEYRKVKMDFMEQNGSIKIMPEDYSKEIIDFPVQLLGEFNQSNVKAALAICKKLGFDEKKIKEALGSAKAPKGRFERLDFGQDFLVVVDYAHTPDGLEKVLSTAKKIVNNTNSRLITVFGCGGDRDRGKRPKMGTIAEAYSDLVIVTSDNPRSEEPMDIIKEIQNGFTKPPQKIVTIENRNEAIFHALKNAKKDDLVMIAGKGHEDYQILKDRTIHFSDHGEVEKFFRQGN